MRRKGNNCEHISHRDRAILARFRSLADRSGCIDLSEISRQIALLPAPRFWVSEERAFVVLSEFRRGHPLPANMRPTKRRMYIEILRRFLLLAAVRDQSSRQLISEIINSPAPEFYMEPMYIEDIIRRRRRNPPK